MHDEAMMSEKELLLLLGKQLSIGEPTVRPESPEALIERAKQWLASKRGELQDAICSNRQIRMLHDQHDVTGLAAAIADLVLSISTGVAPMTVGYLVIRLGLDKLCDAHWSDE